jgi:DNA-binding transcriptional LysR family regulator
LNRTTRQFSMTEAGHTYYRTASDILKEIDNLADLVRENNAQLKGKLKISVPRTYVDADVGQSLIDFARENPDLQLEISADDRFVDLIEEGFDVAIRVTKLEDSGMIARKISDFRIHLCATPEFLERHPQLQNPADLSNVPFIIDTNSRSQGSIRFQNPDGTSFAVAVSGPIEVNSPHATLRAALSGIGIAFIPDFIARKPIESGELVTLFNDYIATDRGIYAVYPHRRYLPAKVRIFVDYLHNWFKKHP